MGVLSTTVVTGFMSGMGLVPNYTQNFVRCFAAAATLRIATWLRGERVLVAKEAVRQCASFGLADWFFLWGNVKALIGISVLQYASMSNALGPGVAAILGYICLKEGLSGYRIFALVRNLALAFLIVNPFGEGMTSISALAVGLWWVLVAAGGTATMRIVQRSNKSVPGTVLTFWGYVINTILWFPPGCIPPQLRIPFLWPSVPADKADLFALPATIWIVMLLSGVFGAGVMVAQGLALKHLDVAMFSTIVTPLGLVLTTLYSALKAPLGWPALVGVLLQVVALIADAYKDKRDHDAGRK